MRRYLRNPTWWILIAAAVGTAAITRGMLLNPKAQTGSQNIQQETADAKSAAAVAYTNTQYGFVFLLPQDWAGYTVVIDKWEGTTYLEPKGQVLVTKGPILSIRNPKWTEQNPYQDIPIMVFTLEQWYALQQDKYHIGAAPIGPSELAANNKYVFALPARYNFAYPTGYEEVEDILKNNPLRTFEVN